MWYPREQQHKILQLDPLLRSWEVLLEAPDNDWRWECEWRIVRSSPPTVALTELRLAGLLVGDQLWSGFVTSTASPPIPDNQDRIISSRRYLLDCRVIGGTAPRSNCCPRCSDWKSSIASVLLVDGRHPRRPRTRALSGADVFLKDAPGHANTPRLTGAGGRSAVASLASARTCHGIRGGARLPRRRGSERFDKWAGCT